jgi:rare lipoprotein A
MVLLVGILISACISTSPSPQKELKKPSELLHPKPYRVGKYWYQPLSSARDFKEKGIASWYGKAFHGKKTSSGEIYDMYAMTAAHKTLPLGIFVRVTNLNTHKSIEVRINDRGPFVRGRIIDLSYTAAKRLNIIGPGTAPVEVVTLGAPLAPGRPCKGGKYVKVDYFSGRFTIQIGAFSDQKNAARLKTTLEKEYTKAHIQSYDSGQKIYYRVRVGNFFKLDHAERFEQKLVKDGYTEAFIVAE